MSCNHPENINIRDLLNKDYCEVCWENLIFAQIARNKELRKQLDIDNFISNHKNGTIPIPMTPAEKRIYKDKLFEEARKFWESPEYKAEVTKLSKIRKE